MTATTEPRRLLHDIADSCRVLGGIGRSTLYDEINRGRIRVTKIGHRTFITDEELQRYVRGLNREVA